MQTTPYYADTPFQCEVGQPAANEHFLGDLRDATIALASIDVWRELRSGTKARSAMPGRIGVGPELDITVATDLAQCFSFDEDAMARLFVNAAGAELKDDLHQFYLQAIALDVVGQVRKIVAQVALDRELAHSANDAEFA